jgi:hypothetical protein
MSRFTRGFPLVIVLALAGCGTQISSTGEAKVPNDESRPVGRLSIATWRLTSAQTGGLKLYTPSRAQLDPPL